MSESIILLVLAGCWAAYLGWYWREHRRAPSKRSDGIQSFATGLGSLGGSAARSGAPAPVLPPLLLPRTTDAAARRRRDVLVSLAMICVITLFAAVALGLPALLLHLLADVALLAYGFAVLQRRNRVAEREIKVTMLYPDGPAPAPAMRRAAGS